MPAVFEVLFFLGGSRRCAKAVAHAFPFGVKNRQQGVTTRRQQLEVDEIPTNKVEFPTAHDDWRRLMC